MAQTAPPPSGENIPRPLPRGGRSSRGRDTRPRFAALDALWMVLLAVLFVTLGLVRHADALGLTVATGVLLLIYLVGWRSSGRPAGVISALLLATSAPFLASMPDALTADLFALLSVGALFSFVAGSSLVALVLAAAAVWLRADGLVLGLMLLTFALIQHRRRAWLGAVLFLVPSLAALFVPLSAGGKFGFHADFWVALATPAMLFTAWFVLPFFGEMADPIRRARWLPTVVWACLYAATASLMSFSRADSTTAAVVPFLPIGFLLAGAGLARLLPVMTGDLPVPALRYTVATLAVLSLVAIRVRTEWPQPPTTQTVSAVPVTPLPPVPIVSAPNHSATPLTPTVVIPDVTTPPAKPPVVNHAKPNAVKLKTGTAKPVVLNTAAAKSKPIAKPATPKPTVRQYMMKNGRLVKRSKWAIQWDLTHPH